MNHEWQSQGACKPIGVDEWFGPAGETGIAAGKRTRRNQDVCLTCPVRLDCARYALETRTSSGVYAGFDLDAPFAGRALKAFVAEHSVVVNIDTRRRVSAINLSDHPQAIRARNRRARIEQQRRNAAAEAYA